MRRSGHDNRMVSRRALVFGTVQGAAGFMLLSRLAYLQFVKGEEFTTQAAGNSIKAQLIVPPRGLITDRAGIPMAANDVAYRLMLESEDKKRALATLMLLDRYVPISPAELAELKIDVKRAKAGVPILIKEHLSWEQMAAIEYHLPQLPTAFIDEGQWRHYPFADHASHLIGYVGRVAEEELTKTSDPLMHQPDFRIGKNGVEAAYENKLRGTPGTRQVEVNAAGSPVRELDKHDPTPGETLTLSIDSRLQEFLVQRMGDESGAVVVMNIHTGEILALVSVPAFDPNEFSKGITTTYWKELNANIKHPLLNKAIAGQYPPGSCFKMMTGLAGLHSGKWQPERRVFCPGYFMLGDHKFTCWKVEGHGSVNMQEALEQSCDTFFYTVGHEAGIDAIADMAHDFGLGATSGLGLRGETPGIIPSPSWKERVRSAVWNPGETINTAIGQGDVLTTPIQLAMMTARIANGGKKVVPTLLAVQGDAEPELADIDIDSDHLAIVQEGMDMVVNNPHGTAYGSGVHNDPATQFSGKTGTAQVRKLIAHGMDQNKLPWEFRHHAWFVGYGPTAKPNYCCAVIIEHGGGGASAAAPIARDALVKALELKNGPAAAPLVIPKEVT